MLLRKHVGAYHNLLENMYVMGNKANYDWLMESKAQLEAGMFAEHHFIREKERNDYDEN